MSIQCSEVRPSAGCYQDPSAVGRQSAIVYPALGSRDLTLSSGDGGDTIGEGQAF